MKSFPASAKLILLPLILTASLLTPVAALADIDWSANNLGFYFDEAATQTAVETGAAESAHAYLVVTNISEPGSLTNWQIFPVGVCTIETGGQFPANWESLSFEIFPRAGTNTPFSGANTGWQGMNVTLAEPLIIADAVVLADLYVSIVTEAPLGIYAEGGGSLEYESSTTLQFGMSTSPISTMPPMLWLQATINSDIVPVPTEQSSFGSIKSLYR